MDLEQLSEKDSVGSLEERIALLERKIRRLEVDKQRYRRLKAMGLNKKNK